ncbi:MAG: rubredoxin [Cyanobacteria bacterium J06639_1]
MSESSSTPAPEFVNAAVESVTEDAIVEPPLIELADDTEEEERAIATEKLTTYKCRSCDYVYEPLKGDQQGKIAPGTAFADLPDTWRCPVCAASPKQFEDVGAKDKPSGFEENLSYGLGVNVMTPAQKNILIFGALGVGFLFFMSLYLLQ